LLWLPPAETLIEEALAAARNSDVVVAVLGLSPDLEGEALRISAPGFVGGDRTDIRLPDPQRKLLTALKGTGKPIVLVLTSGSAIAVDPESADAILEAWYPGQSGGTAIADTLLGRNNPSGRLPVTFYRSVDDLPAFVDYGMKERTFRYFTGKPVWGFGHGLSYTRFAYGVPEQAGTVPAGKKLSLTVKVSNVGARTGQEVIQAYLVPPETGEGATFTSPILQRQLAAFARAELQPKQAKQVSLTIDPRAMSIVDRAGIRRVVPGEYRLWVGGGQPGDGPGQWTSFTVTGQAVTLSR
jgi:beta-glucosidase